MTESWERRRILIWGKTRPEISKSYREIVCTGGVFADTRRFVRLYPIPLRFLTDESTFKKYQWIEVDVQRASDKDPRPESYRIRPDSIALDGHIPTKRGDWSERAAWVLNDHTEFPSMEALHERRMEDHTSLGLVKPAEIEKIYAKEVPQEDRDSYWQRYEDATQQHELPFEPEREKQIKPLGPAEYRFRIKFRCDDPDCSGHDMSILDWEIDALYHRQLAKHIVPDMAAEDVLNKLQNEVCADDRDTRFYLGNIARWPHVFTIVGLWYPKRKFSSGGTQQLLLDHTQTP